MPAVHGRSTVARAQSIDRHRRVGRSSAPATAALGIDWKQVARRKVSTGTGALGIDASGAPATDGSGALGIDWKQVARRKVSTGSWGVRIDASGAPAIAALADHWGQVPAVTRAYRPAAGALGIDGHRCNRRSTVVERYGIDAAARPPYPTAVS